MDAHSSIFCFTASICHLGVEVAPQIPTVCTQEGRGVVISSGVVMKWVLRLARRAVW